MSKKYSALALDVMVRNRQDEYIAIVKQANDNVKHNVKHMDRLGEAQSLARETMHAGTPRERLPFDVWLLGLLGLSASDSRCCCYTPSDLASLVCFHQAPAALPLQTHLIFAPAVDTSQDRVCPVIDVM